MKLKHSICPAVIAARASLRTKHWSYRGTAKELGCSYTHIAYVLTGRRYSASLIKKIHDLPTNPNPA